MYLDIQLSESLSQVTAIDIDKLSFQRHQRLAKKVLFNVNVDFSSCFRYVASNFLMNRTDFC